MPPFTMQELQSAIAELDQAIFSHEQWYKSLLHVLISRVPAEPADLRPDAHQHCRFGQWYGNVSTALLRDHPAFISLGDAHEKMHVYARTLLQLVSDNKPVTTGQLDQFENALDKMRLEIQSLRHELSEVIQSQDPPHRGAKQSQPVTLASRTTGTEPETRAALRTGDAGSGSLQAGQ